MKDGKKALVPALRFPEFREAGEWDNFPLSKISERITEKVGSRKLTTVSITAGLGFVSQAEKFGRDISGNQYKNYILLKRGQFSYNKGNSKTFPQGCIYQLNEFDEVAAPSAFISFKFNGKFVPEFFKGYFDSNFHGYQLLRFITSGARSDGLLNIGPDDFFSIRLPTPKKKEEQQKIADCLSSLDALIAAQADKIDALKSHKKGLMQQLFPREGETVPRLRFPEFRDAGEWEPDRLENLCTARISYGIVQAGPNVPNGMPYIKSTDLNSELCLDNLARTSDSIAKKYRRSEVSPGDIVFSLRGNIGIAKIVPEEIPVANLTQGTARIRPKGPSQFYFQALQSGSVYQRILAVSKGSTLQEISLDDLRKIELLVPDETEQQRIADCLFSIDALIAAQTEKLETLKGHKKGLMQQLFPAGEGVVS